MRRSECVAKKRGSRPIVATQLETSQAYCRLVMQRLVITTATEQKFAGLLASGLDIIIDALPRLFRQINPDGYARGCSATPVLAAELVGAEANAATKMFNEARAAAEHAADVRPLSRGQRYFARSRRRSPPGSSASAVGHAADPSGTDPQVADDDSLTSQETPDTAAFD